MGTSYFQNLSGHKFWLRQGPKAANDNSKSFRVSSLKVIQVLQDNVFYLLTTSPCMFIFSLQGVKKKKKKPLTIYDPVAAPVPGVPLYSPHVYFLFKLLIKSPMDIPFRIAQIHWLLQQPSWKSISRIPLKSLPMIISLYEKRVWVSVGSGSKADLLTFTGGCLRRTGHQELLSSVSCKLSGQILQSDGSMKRGGAGWWSTVMPALGRPTVSLGPGWLSQERLCLKTKGWMMITENCSRGGHCPWWRFSH